ncbi:MAG: response regulator [Candidatus Margulisiibacteriota bacterium]
MNNSDILIIEDEKDIAEAIEYNLKREGFKVAKAYDGLNGLRAAQEKVPALLILDLMLPGMSGIDICKTLKKDPKTAGIAIIMLTAKGEEVDKVVGFEVGADDYMTKPFSMRELIARVRAVLKRYGAKERAVKSILRFPMLEIDIEKHEVKVGGKTVALTAKEFSLLQYLAENQDKAFGRDRLLDAVWGMNTAIETRTVDVHVRRLREKIGKAGKYIKTLRGFGYKFAVK